MIKVDITTLGTVNKKTWAVSLLAPEIRGLYRNWNSRVVEHNQGASVQFNHALNLDIKITLVNDEERYQQLLKTKAHLDELEDELGPAKLVIGFFVLNINIGEEAVVEQALAQVKLAIVKFAPTEQDLAASIWKEF